MPNDSALNAAIASSTDNAASGFDAMVSTQSMKENDEEMIEASEVDSADGIAVAKQAIETR